ncbi:hypothetical protein QE152_g37926 [Popillia japonica]|uniref:Uncharacterized protein n=1 Tax=Popillia japonica TaxID=7064 RepID=A0AAW1I9C4_POPJA
MISKGSQVVEQPSWSSQSASPSPPPPPLPPPVVARWARTEQNIVDSCPHCRGRLASLPTRTTSLSSYSACKGKRNFNVDGGCGSRIWVEAGYFEVRIEGVRWIEICFVLVLSLNFNRGR